MIVASLVLVSCAPVLTRNVMQSGTKDVRFSEIKQYPVLNKGKLFILGGIIVKTTLTNEGSLIEAIYVPVNSLGYLKSYGTTNERFLALYKGTTLLDPLIYSEKREITVAGEFIEIRKGTIGEMDYMYPLFEIKEIYLWEEYTEPDYYRYPPFYYPPYYRFRHYPFYDYPYYPWWY
jgi:outer membrane lipoprotein